MDAINEFKGEWPYEERNMIRCIDSYSMYKKGMFESYTCYHFSGLNTLNWVAVCAEQEFNDLVSQLETNFGTSPTINECNKMINEEYKIGDIATLDEDTNLYSCHYSEVYPLLAGDKVIVVSIGLRPDNGASLITITNGKGFSTLNPDYINKFVPVELINAECYQFDYCNSTFNGYFKEKTGRLYHSTGWFHNTTCTNIKLLTVEVKS